MCTVFRQLLVALTAIMSLVLASAAHAYPIHRRYAKLVYGQSVRCHMCHDPGGSTGRNPYGKDWKKNGEAFETFRRIEALDSDQDGASNLDEIRANSNPGDPRSTPDRPGRYARATDKIPIPAEQIQLVTGPVDRIEALEPELTQATIGKIEGAVGRSLDRNERYPTFYFGVVDEKRTSVAAFTEFRRAEGPYSLLVSIDLEGKIQNVVVFRAGDDTGSAYRPYLNCLRGRGRTDMPRRGGCPNVPGREAALGEISSSVHAVLWTTWALFAAAPQEENP